MKLHVLQALHIRRASGDLHLKAGTVADLPDEDAIRLMAKAPDAVRPAVQAGDWVEWLSPALPPQRGEILAIEADHFEVYHPLAETLCHLPISWVTRIVNTSMTQEGPTP